nr:hypothetical protein [Phenylobacterium sp. J367]
MITFLLGEPGHLHHLIAAPGGRLAGRPDLHPAVGQDAGRGVHRLQRGVHQVRYLVAGLVRPAGGGPQAGAGLGAALAGDHQGVGRVQRGLEPATNLGTVEGRCRNTPLRVQRTRRLERDPGRVGDHGDGVLQPYDLLHAGDGARRRLVHRGQLAAIGRTGADRGEQHAGQAEVDAVAGLTRPLVGLGEGGDRLADVAALGGGLQGRVGRRRYGRGLGGEFAIGCDATRGGVGDPPAGGVAGVGRHVPATRGGLAHLPADAGPGLAQQVPAGAYRLAAAGEQRALHQIGLGLGRLDGLDALPGDAQLVGENLRLAGARALAHLERGGDEGDLAVRGDGDPGERGPAAEALRG